MKNVESEVMSVLVPLSMFATDPDAFRAQFLEERGKRFVRLEDAITKGKSPARTPLSKWRVTRILPASVQSELGLANLTELDALFNYVYWQEEPEA